MATITKTCDQVSGVTKRALREMNRKTVTVAVVAEEVTRQITFPRTIAIGHGRTVERPVTFMQEAGDLYGFYPADRAAQRWEDGYIFIGRADADAVKALRQNGVTEDK